MIAAKTDLLNDRSEVVVHVNASKLSPQADAWRPIVDLAPILLEGPHAGGLGRRLTARILQLNPGPVDMDQFAADGEEWIGVLVLDGLLMVEAEAGRAHSGWLVGADDLIRPWDMAEISLTNAASWRALTPSRIALLDREFSMRAGGIPVLARALVARAARTTNWLLAKSLILGSPVVEERLLLLFALLGERWGTVNHEGVVLKLPLTHAVLATLCGARRPSVTLALGSLEASGILARTAERGWQLRRRCAEELISCPSCWPQYADALGLSTQLAP